MGEREYSVNNTKLYAFTNENLNSFCISFCVRAPRGGAFEGGLMVEETDNGLGRAPLKGV